MDFFTILIFSFFNSLVGYSWFLFILFSLIIGVSGFFVCRHKFNYKLTAILLLFIFLYGLTYFQPGLTIVENDLTDLDMLLGRILSYIINPYSIVLVAGLSVYFVYAATKNKLSFVISIVLFILCFVINGLIFDKVFYYFRDTVIPTFYPYSRKVDPIKFQKRVESCIPKLVLEYNGYVIMNLVNKAVNPETFPKESSNSNYQMITDEHLDKLYNQQYYFEEYLRLCYQNEPIPEHFVNPFVGTDPRNSNTFVKRVEEELKVKEYLKNLNSSKIN
jgi:hypothetical protein